jgi:hypothetical protein
MREQYGPLSGPGDSAGRRRLRANFVRPVSGGHDSIIDERRSARITCMAPLSAGQRLRRDLNSALKRAAREANVPARVFTEIESNLVAIAIDLADLAEKLRARRDAEEAGEARPSVLTKLSAEVRHCERQMIDTLARLDFNVGKSPQHVRAAQQRNRPGRPGAA